MYGSCLLWSKLAILREKTRLTAHEKGAVRMLNSDDGYTLVERDEDRCWLYKEEEEE
jgi:hypothetical protein